MILLFCSSHLLLAEKFPVLFLKTYINHAWGYSHFGFFIDTAGVVFTYTFTTDDSIPYYLDRDTLPDVLFAGLFAKGEPTSRKIPADSLNLMYGMADQAAAGMMRAEYNCADFGEMRYSVLAYDSAAAKMKEIVCIQMGDHAICNSSSAAKTVARWMLSAVDSVDLSSEPLSISCAPDSCLDLETGAAIPLLSHPVRGGNGSSDARYYLDGKKCNNVARRLIVNRNGKTSVEFIPREK